MLKSNFILLCFGLCFSLSAISDVTGKVFYAGSGAGIPYVAVSNGRDITITDEQGRYVLPDHGAFVYLTRTAHVDPEVWFKTRSKTVVDFEVDQPTHYPQSTFFIQMSDTHVYDRKSDFVEFSSPPVPWFIPDFLVPWITINLLEKNYGDNVADKLKAALIANGYAGELNSMSASEVYSAYAEAQSAEQGIFEPLDLQIRAALKEVAGLQPDFVINTGDLVLESNEGSPEAIDRWFRYYGELMQDLPMKVYNTIGNNEIAGTGREDFTSSDARFGKYFFRHYLGPTHFSFDRSGYHFIALDTHSADPQEDNPDYWNFGKMTADIERWFENELKIHADKTIVVLNHEPFHFDERWPFDNDQQVDDLGMFGKYGVDYVLTGHTHYKSAMTIDGVQHLTAGALSGMRWVLPANVHERGYRLFQGFEAKLYSAWKQTGKRFIGLAEPQPADSSRLIIAAVDSSAAFKQVRFFAGKEELKVNVLSDYFFEISNKDNQQRQIKVVARAGDDSETEVLIDLSD